MIVRQIEKKKLDITVNYDTWIRIGFALTDALGEEGRGYFHRLSIFYLKYNQSDCNLQYDRCLHANNSGITSATFFHFARDQGIDISNCRSQQSPVIANPAIGGMKQPPLAKIETYLTSHYHFRYNIVTSKIEYRANVNLQQLSLRGAERRSNPLIPPLKADEATPFVPVTDYIENSLFRELLSNNLKCHLTTLRTVLHSDFCPRYDPFTDYFNSLPTWDKETDYIRDLADTVQTTNEELWQVCFRRWIVASVASVLDPEVVNHTSIIFSGTQGIGKTTWLLNLCPPRLNNYIFSGTINPNNRDTLVQLSECMFINLDELENMTRSEIGMVKEIITKSAIRLRRAYGHHSESLVRRASFMGSVNTMQFLTDTTGSRRFLCFEVKAIDYHHQIDINQVYSQAYSLYQSGLQFWFNPDEVGEIHTNNEQFQINSAEEELLLSHYEAVSIKDATNLITATQLITEICENSQAKLNINPGSVIRMGLALRKHGFIKKKSHGIYLWAVKSAPHLTNPFFKYD